MHSHSKLERFRVSKEELTKLGNEFNSEAMPMLEPLCNTTFWILLNKKFTKKIVKQTFLEAIENCNVTKNQADWPSWVLRIWMREILDYYVKRENDVQTIFDFIDNTEVDSNQITTFFTPDELKSGLTKNKLVKYLEKLPAVLRIPMIMKEIHSLTYEKIAELIDVPLGVIATRIYRARKLFFLSFDENFHYEGEKTKWIQEESTKKIFELRKCALQVDGEMTLEQDPKFTELVNVDNRFKNELMIQNSIKKLIMSSTSDSTFRNSLKQRIEKKANKKFNQK